MDVKTSRSFSRHNREAGGPVIQRKGSPAIAVACALLCASVPASAFVEIARGELILNTTARATYDSNVFAQPDATGDFYFSLIPELQYLRQAGRGTIDGRVGVDFTRFADLTRDNYEDFYGSLDVTLPVHRDSPLSGGVRLAYFERTGIHEFLNRRVSTETYQVDTNLLYRYSERFGIRNTLGFLNERSPDFSNIERISARFGLQHEYSEHLSLFSDYRLRRSRSTGDVEQGVDNLDHAIFIGGTGRLAERVDGTASVGFQHTDARGERHSDANTIVAATDVVWEMRPRTDLSLSISRDIDVSPDDFSAETTRTRLGMTHRIEPKIRLNAHTGYSRIRFRQQQGRRDDAIRIGAGGDYEFSRYWNAGLAYEFTDNDSTARFADYQRHLVHAFTRYSF